MKEENKNNTSIIPFTSNALFKAGNSIEITKKLLAKKTSAVEIKGQLKRRFNLDGYDISDSHSLTITNDLVYFIRYGWLHTIECQAGYAACELTKEFYVCRANRIMDGVIYYGGRDEHSWLYYLYAVDIQTGQLKWKYETLDAVSKPVILNNVVYFGSKDTYFYAVDIKTGQLKWKFKAEVRINYSPAIMDGIVCFGSDDNYFYGLDSHSGHLKWRFEIEPTLVIDKENLGFYAPTIADGIVYFGSNECYFFALDAQSGQLKWKHETNGANISTPAVSEGLVYFGSYDHNLYALDSKTGQVKWKFETEWIIDSTPAIKDGVVYFGGNRYFYAVDSLTGKLKWELEVEGNVFGTPAIADDVIYFMCSHGYLYAVE